MSPSPSLSLRRASVLLAVICATVPAGLVAALPCWRPPVSAPITDPFREPGCAWCPGNRGIEYGTGVGASIRAVASGRVSYAGTIAGAVYVVVRHADGLRVTYGHLTDESFDSGDVVVRGQLIGRAAGRFHLGVREGERYVDPERFIGRLVRRPRLIPADGSPANPGQPPTLTCAT